MGNKELGMRNINYQLSIHFVLVISELSIFSKKNAL